MACDVRRSAIPAGHARDTAPSRSGSAMLPAAAAMVLVAPHSARLVSRMDLDSRCFSVTGSSSSGCRRLRFWKRDSRLRARCSVGFLWSASGVGFARPPRRALADRSSVPVRRAGMASGTADLQRDLGGAIMQSLVGAVLTSRLRRRPSPRPLRRHRRPVRSTSRSSAELQKSFASASDVARRTRSTPTRSLPRRRARSWRGSRRRSRSACWSYWPAPCWSSAVFPAACRRNSSWLPYAAMDAAAAEPAPSGGSPGAQSRSGSGWTARNTDQGRPPGSAAGRRNPAALRPAGRSTRPDLRRRAADPAGTPVGPASSRAPRLTPGRPRSSAGRAGDPGESRTCE